MIVSYEECVSTQDTLRTMLRDDARRPRQLVAVRVDRQTGGRGREGRGWQTPPQQGLLTSLGWRGPFPVSILEDLPRTVALELRARLSDHGGIDESRIGWSAPNDLVDARTGLKLAGVLVDTAITGGEVLELAIGIGANLAGPAFVLEDGRQVTTLEQIAGREVDVSPAALSTLIAAIGAQISARW